MISRLINERFEFKDKKFITLLKKSKYCLRNKDICFFFQGRCKGNIFVSNSCGFLLKRQYGISFKNIN